MKIIQSTIIMIKFAKGLVKFSSVGVDDKWNWQKIYDL